MGFVGIKRWFGTGFKTSQEVEVEEEGRMAQVNEELRLMGKMPVKAKLLGSEAKR